ncbi:GNAT family N-acetyltransferase [Massilia sp. MS-15]|uniref:GNAT family N-acetyltransferase n=1 Tax=Massilia sp. MS-15 TaxID=2878200 RepID=UPI001CD33272|nr:GNAT family N-acetyltransferase [Massilia sp. MS-15]MCA1246897.1 GNAT family N-acetyltransferase [Massilia sp. MS-15]
MNVVLREYAPSDRNSVNAVALAAFAQYEHDYDDWASFRDGIGCMADLAGDADLIIAERETIVGAVVHVGPGRPRNRIFPDDWSIIRMLVVAPQHRGQGIGKRLVAASLARAYDIGAPVVGLHTSPIMANALSLYLALGFKRDCDLPPIKGVPYSRYVLPDTAIPAALDLLNHAERRC